MLSLVNSMYVAYSNFGHFNVCETVVLLNKVNQICLVP